ncbi:putative solute:sodium symporter (SSS) family protein [Gregarina niphandrodes]|uniref:Solute:sodium symporter (SSS) family protein n=1 Tax=Gregarina niphandrodes TaxID=110365 RepID=A0A023BC54_GRENI|nr:putative solute:sodium symporter (SSS) family protein [Gregarina niphandrodes]EZG81690.1 putative solute:sodium symporter (SSS) family protein [Gregarina niphandrodes]|eukprot:XP_011134196.1 putative solute:sodium symporter (SSS) family protein [Gregarina niphandrodes]
MGTEVAPSVASVILALILVGFIVVVWYSGYVSKAEIIKPTGNLVSAFNSQRWWSLACSFFAAAFGASALVANPEAGATGGWLQVFCYGIANGMPYFLLSTLGPRMQSFFKTQNFTVADFVRKRYGMPMYVPTVILSLFFLFIWLTAELTSIADSFSLLSPGFYTPAAVVCVGFGVAMYALFAGFKGSLLTDRIQAVMALLCTFALITAVACYVKPSKQAWSEASSATSVGEGISGGIVLILSTTLNQFLDLGSWQRVFASEDKKQARIGLFVAGSVNFLCQALMTFMGIYAMAAAVAGEIALMPGDEALGFYILLSKIPLGFNVIALVCVLTLSISTVDSIENSLASAFAELMLEKNVSLNWARGFALLLVGLAVGLATTQQSVLSLFLFSNIFASCIVPPIFLGLSYTMATTTSALGGFISGVLTIFIIGWSYQKSFVEGLKWPMFPEGFNHWATLLTFILCPVVATLVTISVAKAWPSQDTHSLHSTLTGPEVAWTADSETEMESPYGNTI